MPKTTRKRQPIGLMDLPAANAETAAAVRTVIADWDGSNWSAVRAVLRRDGLDETTIDKMTAHDVRMHFAIGQRPITLALGGQPNTHHATIVVPEGGLLDAEAPAELAPDDDWVDADWIRRNTNIPMGRIRQATTPKRKKKLVHKRQREDKTVEYFFPDLRRNWRTEIIKA